MAEKCRNEGCPFNGFSTDTNNCSQYRDTSGCDKFTTTPTQSITVERLKELEEIERNSCDECLPDNYGWKHNRVDGKHPCTCMTESEPYQILQAENKRLAGEVERLKASNEKVSDEVNSRLLESKA